MNLTFPKYNIFLFKYWILYFLLSKQSRYTYIFIFILFVKCNRIWYFAILMNKWGRRVIRIAGSPTWSDQKPWWNCYSTHVVNFGEVWRAQLAKSTLISTLGPLGSFQNFLRSVQLLMREWGAESNGKLQLQLVKLQPWFLSLRWTTCHWAEHSHDEWIHC